MAADDGPPARPGQDSSADSADREAANWHALSPDEALVEAGTDADGLTSETAAARLEEYGPNQLPERPPTTFYTILLRQFLSPLIYVLIAAGIVSLALEEMLEAVFIFVIIALNAGLGAFQEARAERSAAALQSLVEAYVQVRRDGRTKKVNARDLVPGDVVLLESGLRVPADLRLLQTQELTVDQAFLTGESEAVLKSAPALPGETMLPDRDNVAFAGSTVITGRGRGMVVATGINTEVGKIAESVHGREATKSPLTERMERFARNISYVVLGASILLALIGLLRQMELLDIFFLAVALAVSAIPEGLPIAITVALSIATTRMAARNVIVRQLAAVEGLGSCTYIGSDKTGTLTVNQQTVRRLWLPDGRLFSVSGEGYRGEGAVTLRESAMFITHGAPGIWENGSGDVALDPGDVPEVTALVRAGVLCNEASLEFENEQWEHQGDAVDVALLALGYKLNLRPETLRAEHLEVGAIPFESYRRFAAAFYQEDDGGPVQVAVKGAAEALLPRCETMMAPGGGIAVDVERIQAAVEGLAGEGYRVLAVAHGQLEPEAVAGGKKGYWISDDLPPLMLLGLVGLIDPLRPEAPEAVGLCRDAGIQVTMITGDHPGTALAIARDLGIAAGEDDVMTGAQLERLDPEAAGPDIARTTVFARVTPMQKLQIVEAVKNQGHFVAVTGDGVNDAPALREAHVGVAMGSGTDITRDAASIIVTDDNFASIEAGVEEGRFAYDNVRKVTYLLISTGAAEVLLFSLALLFAVPLPLLPLQILWLNLVTNGIQDVALAFEGGEPGAMKRPPRDPDEGIFNRLMIEQTILSGAVIGGVAFVTWLVLLGLGYDEPAARNMLLLLMVLFQNVHVFNCRSERASAFRVPLARNPILIVGVLAAQGVHVGAMHIPLLQELLGMAPLPLTFWGEFILLALTVLVAMELFKWLRAHRL